MIQNRKAISRIFHLTHTRDPADPPHHRRYDIRRPRIQHRSVMTVSITVVDVNGLHEVKVDQPVLCPY